MSEPGSGDDEDLIIVGSCAGGIVLLILLLFSITFLLLCKIMRRLRMLEKGMHIHQHSRSTSQDTKNAADPPTEEKLSNRESPDPNTLEEALNIESMYSVVSHEHREKKRQANIQIQQYDDIDLLPLDSERGRQNLANESGRRASSSHLQNTSVTIEDNGTGYSRLCHAGPRKSQTRKQEYLHHSLEQLQQDGRKSGASAANSKGSSYSEVRPTSQLIVAKGNYSMISEVKPPPIPIRLSICIPSEVESTQKMLNGVEITSSKEVKSPATPKPYQNMSSAAPEPDKDKVMYDKVETPKVTDNAFFDESFLSEFHNVQAQSTLTEKLYDVVN